MRADEAFEFMIARVGRMPIPTTFRERVQRWLKYFYQQSLADSDRRESTEKLQQNFRAFELEIAGYNVLAELRKLEAWKVALNFADKRAHFSFPAGERRAPFFDSPAKIPLCPKHDFWTVEKLLTQVRAKLSLIKMEDAQSALVPLDLLILEAQKAAFARNKSLIRKNWEIAKPILIKHKVFDEFSGSLSLRHRLAFFLFGRI